MIQAVEREYIPLSIQRHNLLYVILDGIAIGLISAGGSFISVFVIRLGASPLWVSLLSSIPSMIALVMTMPWSRFIERQGRPQTVLAWARLAGYALYLPLALLPFILKGEWAARVIVIIWSLTGLSGSLTTILFTLVMGHAVPPERRAFQMSRRWIVMGLAQSLALPGVSWLFANLPFPRGYQLVFLANFAIAFWSFYCVRQIHIEKRIAPPPARAQRQPLPVQLRQTASEILAARPFLVFISGKMLYNLGLALVSALINIYWVKHLNFTDIWVGYMTMTVTVATLVSYLPWVRIKHRIGTQRMVVISVLGSALYPALLSLARTPVATLPIVALNGVVGAGLNLAFFDALLEVCPPDKEARFVALNSTVVYLTGVVGPPVGAALLGALSIRWVMVISTLVALTGVAVFAFASAGERTRAA